MCEKRFTNSGHLRNHKMTHTGDKPHKCDICEKGFAANNDLQSHRRIHTGDMPYKCDIYVVKDLA